MAVGAGPMTAQPFVENQIYLRKANLILRGKASKLHTLVVTAVVFARPKVSSPRVLLNGAFALGQLRNGN